MFELTPFTQVTHGIRISVVPQYLEAQSAPKAQNFSFAYTVLIRNERPEAVQLMRRHWYVFSNGELLAEVEGEGVVGAKPVIKPRDSFQYTSGVVINDPVGAMTGFYTFIDTNGNSVVAEIPPFDLVSPQAIH
jgi:ApaG protein